MPSPHPPIPPRPCPSTTHPPPAGLEVSETGEALDAAALQFAEGHTAAAAEALRALLPYGDGEAWLMLFDAYQAIGCRSDFERLALEFAARFERSAPSWSDVGAVPAREVRWSYLGGTLSAASPALGPEHPAPGRQVPASGPAAAPAPSPANGGGLHLPGGRPDLPGSGPGPDGERPDAQCRGLDFSALVAVEPAACGRLAALLDDPGIEWRGGERLEAWLRARLAAAGWLGVAGAVNGSGDGRGGDAPDLPAAAGERSGGGLGPSDRQPGNPAIGPQPPSSGHSASGASLVSHDLGSQEWRPGEWASDECLLFLRALARLGKESEYEAFALAYAAAFEVSPPAWTPPAARPDAVAPEEPSARAGFRLSGELAGPGDPQLRAFADHAVAHPALVVEAHGLRRADFHATARLLNLLGDCAAAGKPVEIRGVGAMVGRFFRNLGIGELATLTPRAGA